MTENDLPDFLAGYLAIDVKPEIELPTISDRIRDGLTAFRTVLDAERNIVARDCMDCLGGVHRPDAYPREWFA